MSSSYFEFLTAFKLADIPVNREFFDACLAVCLADFRANSSRAYGDRLSYDKFYSSVDSNTLELNGMDYIPEVRVMRVIVDASILVTGKSDVPFCNPHTANSRGTKYSSAEECITAMRAIAGDDGRKQSLERKIRRWMDAFSWCVDDKYRTALRYIEPSFNAWGELYNAMGVVPDPSESDYVKTICKSESGAGYDARIVSKVRNAFLGVALRAMDSTYNRNAMFFRVKYSEFKQLRIDADDLADIKASHSEINEKMGKILRRSIDGHFHTGTMDVARILYLIAEYVQEKKYHPTVDQMYERVKGEAKV